MTVNSSTVDLSFNTSYTIATTTLGAGICYTFNETVTFPAGYGSYLTSIAPNGQYSAITITQSPTITLNGSAATATSATIKWQVCQASSGGCACFGVQWGFSGVPWSMIPATGTTDKIVYSTATVASSGSTTCSVNSISGAKSVTVVLNQTGNDGFGGPAPIFAPQSSLVCNTGTEGVDAVVGPAPGSSACGGA